jgi:hypothetical protein
MGTGTDLQLSDALVGTCSVSTQSLGATARRLSSNFKNPINLFARLVFHKSRSNRTRSTLSGSDRETSSGVTDFAKDMLRPS